MNYHDEEIEIKIEYKESFDVDPLSERYENVITVITEPESQPIPNVQQIEENTNTENVFIEINTTTWYKSIDNFGKYLCKFCDLSYSTIQTIRNHVKSKHTEHYNNLVDMVLKNIRQPKIRCHICKKKFKNIAMLKNHVTENYGINNIKKSCHQCHANFENNSEIIYHILNKDSCKKIAKHLCNICGYSTNKLSHYNQHANTHTRVNTKKCLHCDYRTNYASNMKIHLRIHTNEKPYKCDYENCNYKSSTKSGLNSHILKHDRESNMLYCDKCSYKTVYRQSLKKHTDSHRRNNVRTVV